MRSIEPRRAAGFTLLEILVALVIAGLAMSAIVGVFGNSLAGHAVVSDTETALALAERGGGAAPGDRQRRFRRPVRLADRSLAIR
jgi:prepilin-type N-terminal cleavage/methylation domain-containing protein